MSKRRGYLSSSEIKKSKQGPKKVNRIKVMLKENKEKFRCNHIDADTGKSKLKPSNTEGKQYCKLCKTEIYVTPKVVNSKSLQSATDLLFSGVSIIRHEMALTEEFEEQLIKFNEMSHIIPIIYEEMENERKAKKDKNKEHGKKKHGKKKHGFKRI